MKFFGGKKLLQWKDPQSLLKAHEQAQPRWKRLAILIGGNLGMGILVSTCITISSIISADGETGSWIDNISFIFVFGAIFGAVMGLLFFVISKIGPPKVIIRDKAIQCTNGQNQVSYWYRRYDFFDIGTAEELTEIKEEVDGRPLRYVVLCSLEREEGIRFEISPEIDDSEIYNILIERLPPADVYFANQES